MWIAHLLCSNTDERYAGFTAKPFVPRVPLVVTMLAGALPDVVFVVLQFLGIESFKLD